LIGYLSTDPAHPAARATLDVLAASQTAEEAAAKQGPQAQAQVRRQLQDRLVQLARDYPDFWPLQEVVIRHYLRTDMVKAAETAWSATPNFVGNPEPPRIAAEAYASLRRWTRVTEAATIWRQRSGTDTIPADILLAEAQIAQKQPAAALRILEPLVAAHPLPKSDAATQPSSSGVPQQTLLDLHRTYGRALLAAGRGNEAQEALKPMLAMGADGRSAWMAAASAATDASAARQWLERVAAGIPRGAVNEFVALADSWLECGRKLRDVSLLKSADALLDPLITDGKPPVDALRLLGLTSHYLGDYDKAERCWRAVADDSKGTDPEAMNNLAYVLLVRGNAKDVAEATSLAEKAVAASAEPAFLGTLARARSKNGDRAGAITAYRQALAKDAATGVDDNVESRLGLAEELSRGKDAERTEALRLVLEAKRLMDAGPLQPPEIQKALSALLESLK
jgi:tetratricopeptide (TPR) repeat protein